MVIYTSAGILDVYDDIKYPFNYSIGDVRDITKRNIDYSKTIKLPATKNNNEFFGFFFNVNVQSGSFNANTKEFITVEEDGKVVFKGFLQLLSVTINNGFTFYEGVVFSSFRNILDIVEGLDLNDLDFSEYNHPFEFQSFVDSTSVPRLNYRYYDYTYTDENGDTQKVNNSTPSEMNNGYGYVYPFISYDGNYTNYAYKKNTYPAFFVREYIDKIFLLAGFKVESKFFDTDYFKSLILPFTNGSLVLTSDDAEVYGVSYSEPSSTYLVDGSSSVLPLPVIVTNEITDELNQYNTTNHRLTVNKSGNKNIRFTGEVSIEYVVPSGKTIYRRTSTTFTESLRFAQRRREGGTNISVGYYYYSDYVTGISSQPLNFNDLDNNTYTVSFNTIISEADSDITDDLTFIAQFRNNAYYYVDDNGFNTYLDANVTFNNLTFNYQLSEEAEIINGDTINADFVIPKFKITDFLKSIITMFNLYIYPKDGAENTLLIETRDEFYSNNKTHFFEDRLDKSKSIKIATLSEESAKVYLYKYKEGKDYISKEYLGANDGKSYAQKQVITDNQFLTKIQSYTISFAATGDANVTDVNNEDNGGVIPVIFDREQDSDAAGSSPTYVNKPIKSEPRILFYGAEGYAGSREQVSYPTYSLDFEAMKQTPEEAWTPHFDLYNLFHKNTIEEVSSPDAKLLTCYLKFNISEIFIGDKIYILGEYWRINRIIDYDANSNESTKVELFKLKGNVNYLTAEQIIEQSESNNSLFNTQFNNKFS